MAWENSEQFFTAPASTGLRQFRAVKIGATGSLSYPSASTVGEKIVGVLVSSGTTGSTGSHVGTVQHSGVAKIEAAASTSAFGNVVSASSVGQAQPSSNAGDFQIGQIVDGTSGAANRVLSILLQPIGSTVIQT